ncbi:MAG: GGDEF domain-containing protein [SAR86 cluster bacterium]|uniref:GGDEF domain-containing protein n=1 Tax=SAR86 cluster bacterium TaxID=2030880 RepID=A0A2A5CCA8_9GAMM|nr:diguanylate cyclase [bacterium AH-315-I11]PCJ41151.1 MAG: GGDEF domain-containing protein [SAR86 cluster bacterium]
MLPDMKITKKLPFVMIAFALLSAIATGVIAFVNARDSMIGSAQDKLTSLLESRKSSLQQYFDTIEHDVQFHAQSPLVINALQDFSNSWEALPNDKEAVLRDNYIFQNPYPVGNKGALLAAEDGSQYSRVHRQYHPAFSNMVEARFFYDLFLFDPQGNLIYTVNKESDFATNIETGQWKDTQLATLFRDINENPQAGLIDYADFMPYEPTSDKPASFIGAPVFNAQYQYLGILIYQLPIEPLNNIMQVTAGMGETGETYLVGDDFLMRSDSRFLEQSSILSTEADTYSVRQGLAGESAVGVIYDYRDISVFSAYTPIDFMGTRWVMLAEVDREEVLRDVYSMSRFLLFSGVLIAVAISFLGYMLAADISHPIATMTQIIRNLSRNKLDDNISVNNRKDEVGEMADAMVILKQNAVEQESLKAQFKYVAEHDVLTGLRTRQYALEELDCLMKQADKDGTKLVLMFIDLDDFKHINDVYGHNVGDDTLCLIAKGLQECARSDDIIARVGGDEFIIILPNIKSIKDSHIVVNKISSAMKSLLLKQEEGESNKKLTLSIGLAIYPDDAVNAASLLKNADRAMYTVKRNGKNNLDYWKQDMDSNNLLDN